MNWQILLIVLILPAYSLYKSIMDEPSVARLWNEALLNSIRMDYARPTVHARNLFHTSIAMYDAWALFDDTAETYLIGKTVGVLVVLLQHQVLPMICIPCERRSSAMRCTGYSDTVFGLHLAQGSLLHSTIT